MVQLLWKIIWQFLKSYTHRITIYDIVILLHIYSRKNWKNQTYFYTSVHRSITQNSQKMGITPVCINRWTNKQNVVCTYIGLLLSLENEILMYAQTLTHLENIMLHEKRQTKTGKYCMIPLIWLTKNRQILFFSIYLFIYLFYFICSEFCHTLKRNSHGFTCFPHPVPPSHLPLHPLPPGLPSAPGPSACLMHPTWAGDLFHPW